MLYSIIIPVYNRPDEMQELLESLDKQTLKRFEVVIIEDGSGDTCKHIADTYAKTMDITYHEKPNTGRSDSRNVGMRLAKGDYMIIFDSDCIIPPQYLEIVDNHLKAHPLDFYGGPDAADSSFSDIQKAISHSMTSFLTTGGIRGGKKQMEKFCPRSFNMGISRKVFEYTKGFYNTLGEDIDFSLRAMDGGFTSGLIREAFVYHKRRVDLKKFYRQVNTFGQARIYLHKLHPGSLKLVHMAPAVFTLGLVFILLASFVCPYALLLPALYFLMILLDSLVKNKSLKVAALSTVTGFIQIVGYGTGFIKAFWQKVVCRQPVSLEMNVETLYKTKK